MHLGKTLGIYEFMRWTQRDIFFIFISTLIPSLLYSLLGWSFLALPVYFSTVLGTALALVISFKNNTAYQRMAEGHKLYADIKSTSLLLGEFVNSLIQGEDPVEAQRYRQLFVNQHLAWLTVLRYQLREPRIWENTMLPENIPYLQRFCQTAEKNVSLETALAQYLPPSQLQEALISIDSAAAYCLSLQMHLLTTVLKNDYLVSGGIKLLGTTIGRLASSESDVLRVKNVPYPRTFYQMALYFRNLFIWTLPLTLLPQLDQAHRLWQAIPICVVIGWVFMSLEKVGQNIMYPFEGGPNDVPITTITRHIEIVMKKSIGDTDIPDEIKPAYEIAL